MTAFRELFLRRLLAATWDVQKDNWPEYRYGPLHGRVDIAGHAKWLDLVVSRADELGWLYTQLADDHSRAVLMDVLLYRCLGPHRVRHRRSTPEAAAFRAALDTGNDRFSIVDRDVLVQGTWRVHRVRLHPEGIVAQVAPNFLVDIVDGDEYHLVRPGVRITVEPGDVVLDGGACWGETALLFAHRVGAAGAVHAFELSPKNLAVLRDNLARNPELAARVTVVQRALAARSGETLRFADQGLASHQHRGGAIAAETLTVDDHVRAAGLDRVDVLKLDIEGGEAHAIDGAVDTIRRLKPKLMISAYHRMDDLIVLPRRLRQLRPDARMYLDHHTIHGEETVLYVEGG